MLLAISDAVSVATINVIGIIFLTWLQNRSDRRSDQKNEKVVRAVEEVHKATNSLVDRLVSTTKTEAHAAGVKEELDRPKS